MCYFVTFVTLVTFAFFLRKKFGESGMFDVSLHQISNNALH